MPAGPLREKINSIYKYDAIFLNGNEEETTQQIKLIKKYNKNIEIFETYYNAINVNTLDLNNEYLIFSGIGNPDSFKKTLIKNKIKIVKEIIFADHYNYTLKDIKNIKLLAKNLNAKILTTEKDYLRINNKISSGIDFLQIELIIKNEDNLIKFIKSHL